MKNRFFLRRLGRFFAIMLIPTLLLFLASLFVTGHSTQQKMYEEGEQTVSAVETNLQLVVNGAFVQNEYLTSMVSMSTTLKRVLSGEELSYGDAIYSRSMQSVLSSITRAYDYIDSAAIYLDGSKRVLSSGKGIETIANSSDQGWLAVYQGMDPAADTCVAARTRGQGRADETRLLTICQRLLLQKGCVVININVRQLQAMLDTLNADEGQAIFLVDDAGRLLARTDTGGYAAKLDVEQLMADPARRAALTAGGAWERQNGAAYLVTVRRHETPGIYIVSAISERVFAQSLLERFGAFFALMVIDLGVVMALAYYTTRRSFDHISSMLKMFDEAEKGLPVTKPARQTHDEYDVIMNNMVCMFLNTSYLNMQLKAKQFRQENAELTALQLQINPHFLYNTLQTLDMEARRMDDGGQMSLMIRHVSDILRYALSDPQKPVSLGEELDYLKKYAEVQQYRFGSGFIIYYEIDPALCGAAVFRLMLQPVLENSLLHGLRGRQGAAYVKVRARHIGEMLELRVIDNGTGMDRAGLAELRRRIADRNGRSIGLTNLNRRLQLRYGDASVLHVCSIKNLGTSVSFRIPYHELPEQKQP